MFEEKAKMFRNKDANGKLTNYFIGIRNGKSENQHIVREGYEKVVVARLSDSEFFYENDIKKTTESSLERLKGLIFQKEIGTVYEKLLRIKALANFINEESHLSCDSQRLIKSLIYQKRIWSAKWFLNIRNFRALWEGYTQMPQESLLIFHRQSSSIIIL
jgi:glycyl-tRNA synthetase beta chain